MADLSVLIDAENYSGEDQIYGAARNTATALRSAGLQEYRVVVQDALNASLNPEQAAPSESLKISASGQVELFGLVGAIRVQDSVTAQLANNDLSAALIENLKIADQPTETLSPEQATPTDALKVADIVLGPTINPEQASPAESLKISDTPLLTLDPEQASALEALKVADLIGPTLDPEQASPAESLKIAEILSVLLTGSLSATVTESLKIADTILGPTLDPEQAAIAEACKVSASGQADLLDTGPVIHVVDGPVLAALVANDLQVVVGAENIKVADVVSSVTLDPEQASSTDALKVADAIQASVDLSSAASEPAKVVDSILGPMLDPEQAAPVESLKVADTVTAVLGGNLSATVGSEALKLADTVFGPTLDPEQAAPLESCKVSAGGQADLIGNGPRIHVVDGPVVAQLFSGLAADAGPEPLKVGDTLFATLDPLIATPAEVLKVADGGFVEISHDETIKVADTVQASIPGTDLSVVVVAEALKVADAQAEVLDPEQVSLAEALKVADTPIVVLDLGVILQLEALKVQDGPSELLNPEQVSQLESLKVQDAVIAALGGNLIVSVTDEALKVQDAPQTTLDPEQIPATEALKVVDLISVTLDPEQTPLVDALKIADQAATTINPEQAAPSELLRLADLVIVSLGTLQVSISERVRIVEELFLLGNPETIEIIGVYQTIIEVVGEYRDSISATGEQQDTIDIVGELGPLVEA